jgi:hypothetical protein
MHSRRGSGYYRQKVKKEWLFWRPIVYNVLTFTEACENDPEVLTEANIALDIKFEKERQAAKKK